MNLRIAYKEQVKTCERLNEYKGGKAAIQSIVLAYSIGSQRVNRFFAGQGDEGCDEKPGQEERANPGEFTSSLRRSFAET